MEEPTMSEESTTNAEPAAEAAGETEQGTAPELGDAGQKAIKAERDARKAAEKSAAELAAKLQEIENANLSDLERAKQEAEANASELAKLRADNTRQKVALEKGVPSDLIEFLTGADEEEIAAKADILLTRLKAPTSPKPDPTQGAAGVVTKPSTAEQFAAQLADF